MRGWSSYHANSEEDRRFKLRYSDLADGYTRGDCQWSGTNAYDGEYTFTRGSNYYAFGIKSFFKINHANDRTFSFLFCSVNAPPPPAPPPPPPGSNGVPTVAIGVQAVQVTDREFDFQITVSDNDCSDVTNCLGTPSLVNANTAKGLQCDAYVASSSTDTSCTYATSGSYLPCKKWRIFTTLRKRTIISLP